MKIYRGWWVVAAAFMAAAINIGSSQYAFGLYIEPLEDAFGWSRTQISAALSFSAIGSLTAPVVGRVMDRYGAKPVMVTSVSLIAASYFLRPLMTELWHWYALSVLQYLAFSGAAMLPGGRLVGMWFRRTRGRVMGITMMGNNFGGLFLPPAAGFIIAGSSWQTAYLATGAIALVIMLYSLVVVSEKAPVDDADRAQTPMPSQPSGASRRPELTGVSLREAMRSRAFYIFTIAFLSGSLPFAMLLPQMIPHLTNEGFSVTAASLALSVMAAAGMTGKLLFGLLAERITAQRTMMVSFSGLGVVSLVMGTTGSTWILWPCVPLFGLCMGAFGALSVLVIQDNFGLKSYGSISGVMNVATAASFAIGPIVTGITFDITDSYRIAFATVAAAEALGVVLLSQALRRKGASG
jgi:MFS family permease